MNKTQKLEQRLLNIADDLHVGDIDRALVRIDQILAMIRGDSDLADLGDVDLIINETEEELAELNAALCQALESEE
jgi:hypothetical protein